MLSDQKDIRHYVTKNRHPKRLFERKKAKTLIRKTTQSNNVASSSVPEGSETVLAASGNQDDTSAEVVPEPVMKKRRTSKEDEKRVYVWVSEFGGAMGPWWIRIGVRVGFGAGS